MKKILLFVVAIATSISVNAQTADEIIANYFENIGGLEKLKQVKGVKMTAKINQQGMEIPLEIIQMSDGKQMTVINFQGKEMKQGVFDGETLWGHNFMTMKAEKSDEETTENMKLDMNDFPDSFIDYKEKGYAIELLGKETIDGAETFKIKLTKEPITIDGKKASIPSIQIKVGQKISVSATANDKAYWKTQLPKLAKVEIPSWLALDSAKHEGQLVSVPTRQDLPISFDPTMIVEFYSR